MVGKIFLPTKSWWIFNSLGPLVGSPLTKGSYIIINSLGINFACLGIKCTTYLKGTRSPTRVHRLLLKVVTT
jgi:hypothetical protein